MIAQPIRIVPFHPGPAAALVTQAQLTYRGGPLLGAVEVVTAFWGAEWLADEAPLLTQINDFFLYILDSPLIDRPAESWCPITQMGKGSLPGTENLPTRRPAGPGPNQDSPNQF